MSKSEQTSRAMSAIALGAAAIAAPAPAHAQPPPQITSVVEQGYGLGGTRAFRLHGTFPPAAGGCVWDVGKHPAVDCMKVLVFCNGALTPAKITAKSNVLIDIRIPQRPSGYQPGTGSQCAFVAQRWDVTGFAAAQHQHGLISPPPIEIHGTADRGTTAGQHHYELYGYFPVGAGYASSVLCDGVPMTSGITTPNYPSTVDGQVNIWFAEPDSTSKSCEIAVHRSDGAATPPWYERVNGPAGGGDILHPSIGAYHWGGFEPDWLGRRDALPESVRRMKDAGIRGPIRFSLSPVQRGAYPASSTDWYDDFTQWNTKSPPTLGAHIESGPGERCAGLSGLGTFLPSAVCTRRFLDALAEIPVLSTIVLTTIDEATTGDLGTASHHYKDPAWLSVPENYNLVKDEYKHMAAALFQTQAGTGKTIVISNWETDSMLFPGDGPGGFAEKARACRLQPSKRVACSATAPPDPAATCDPYGVPWSGASTAPDCTPKHSYLQVRDGLKLWFQARKQGIDEARAAVANPTATVVDAIEIASYRDVQGEGIASGCTPGYGCLLGANTLHGIVPHVNSAYVLYSAWETTNAGLVDQDLREISAYLYNLSPVGSRKLGLGEFGRTGQASRPFDTWVFRESVSASRRVMDRTGVAGFAPLRFNVIWQAFPTIDEEQALFTVEGVETGAMRALVAGSGSYGAGTPGTQIAVNAVRELARGSGTRTFELYGAQLPAGDLQVWKKCNTDATPPAQYDFWSLATVVGTPSAGQVNITIPDVPGQEIWCTLRVRRTSTGETSPHFGPLRSCGNGSCNPVSL